MNMNQTTKKGTTVDRVDREDTTIDRVTEEDVAVDRGYVTVDWQVDEAAEMVHDDSKG